MNHSGGVMNHFAVVLSHFRRVMSILPFFRCFYPEELVRRLAQVFVFGHSVVSITFFRKNPFFQTKGRFFCSHLGNKRTVPMLFYAGWLHSMVSRVLVFLKTVQALYGMN